MMARNRNESRTPVLGYLVFGVPQLIITPFSRHRGYKPKFSFGLAAGVSANSFHTGPVPENGCIVRSGVFGIQYEPKARHCFAKHIPGGLGMSVDPALQSANDQGGNAESRWRLDRIVAELRTSRDVLHNIWQDGPVRRAPSRETLETILEGLVAALFPRHYGRSDLDTENIDYFVGNTLNIALNGLLEQVHRGNLFVSDRPASDQTLQNAIELTRTFASTLPEIRGVLVSDLRAAFVGDPAATSFPEILIGYPGMTAVIHHRIAHVLYRLGAKLVARLIAEIAHTKTGIDIHPGASIGSSFFIDHGTGVVIGETAVIGERVRIYQAVTLGARHFPTDREGNVVKGAARHPVVEDDVIIYAGATILGRIVIGHGSTIGGNVWLTEDVPPDSFVTQATARSKAGPR
jgi:serine O-acetyltransferase